MRTHRRRDVRHQRMLDTSAPQIVVNPAPLMTPPKGLNYEAPTNRVPPEFSRHMKNMWLDYGRTRSRYGTVEIGSQDTDATQVFKFVTADNISFLFRFLDDDVELWDGSTWSSIMGSYTIGVGAKWCWTAFGSYFVFSNGWDGMYEFDPMGGSVTLIEDAPSATYLTTFGGRIIASDVRDPFHVAERISWCAKYDSRDWTGEGAGFEDLRSTPAGSIDAAMGTWPISDYEAMVVRRRSVWQMTETGNILAPYRFSRVFADMGTDCPWSMAAVQGGLVGVFTDDVYVLGSGQPPVKIGTQIRRQLFDDIGSNSADVTGAYNPVTSEYLLSIGDEIVYRYSFIDQGWSRSEYTRSNVTWVTCNRPAYFGLTIDDLTGTIDEQTGTIDELGGTNLDQHGVMFVGDGYVFVEDDTATDDEVDGVQLDAPIELWSAVLVGSSPLYKVRLIEVQVEYEAAEAQNLTFEYSYDDGATWTSYSTATVSTTSGPDVLSVRKVFTHHKIMLRVRSGTLGGLTIIAIHAFVTDEARVKH